MRQTRPHGHQICFAVFRTERFNLVIQLLCQRILEMMCVERRSAHHTAHKIHGRYFVPLSLQKSSKFDRMLGADSPAIATSGAEAHVMQDLSLISFVRKVESTCRTVLHARETPVALFVDAKKAHGLLLFQFLVLIVSGGDL